MDKESTLTEIARLEEKWHEWIQFSRMCPIDPIAQLNTLRTHMKFLCADAEYRASVRPPR